MRAEFERCAREGTPRPESQAVRAHVPATFWSFANTWRDVFKNGVADHKIKELCRIYVSRSVLCEFCGNQRSIKAAKCGPEGRRLLGPDQFRVVTRNMTSGRRPRSPMPNASPGTCPRPTNCGRGCTSISASPNWSRSAISSPSPWASSAGCARSTSSIIRFSPATTARWRRASRRWTSSRSSKQAADYWAKLKPTPQSQAAE